MPGRPAKGTRNSIAVDVGVAERRRRALISFFDRHADELENYRHWARLAGLPNANGIYNFLARRTNSLSTATLERLASVVPGASVEDLLDDRGADPRVMHLQINIPAERGRWRSATTTLLRDAPADGMPVPPWVEAHMAVRVEDDHAAHLGVPKGAIALVCDAAIRRDRMAPGVLVLVRRLRGSPARQETTICRMPSDTRNVASWAGRPESGAGRLGADRVHFLGRVTWVAYEPAPAPHEP